MNSGMADQRARRILWAALILLWPATAALAGVYVSPTSVKVELRPGTRFIIPLKLIGLGEDGMTKVRVTVTDITQPSALGREYPPVGTTPYSCATYLNLARQELELKDREERIVTVRGSVPASAQGSRHCAIMVEPFGDPKPSAATTTNMTLGVRVAVPVDIDIPGPAKARLEVSEINFMQAAKAGGVMDRGALAGKMAAQIIFRNDGERAGWPSGFVFLRDRRSGRILQRASLGLDRLSRILPKSPGAAHVFLPQAVPAGEYRLEVQARYGAQRKRLQATREFVLDKDGNADPIDKTAAEAEEFALSLNTDRVEVPLSPGMTTQRMIRLRNDDSIPLQCKIEAQAFTEEPDGTMADVTEETGSQLVTEPESILLAPNSAQLVKLRVTAGAGLDPAYEHYWQFRITGRPATSPADAPKGIALVSALIVASDRRQASPPALRLIDAKIAPELEYTDCRFVVKNGGGLQIPLRGSLKVYEGEAQEPFADVPITTAPPTVVLAGSARMVNIRVPKPLTKIAWRCVLTFDNLGDRKPFALNLKVNPAEEAKPAAAPGAAPVGPLAPVVPPMLVPPPGAGVQPPPAGGPK